MRAYPEGPIIGTMREGEPLTVLYGIQTVNGLVWIEVIDQEGSGWVGAPDVHQDRNCITPTPSTTPEPDPKTVELIEDNETSAEPING